MARFNARDMAVVFIIMLAVRAVTSYHILRRDALVFQSTQNSSRLIPSPPERRLHSVIPPFWLNHWTGNGSIQSFYSGPVMPCIRGRSRRGAAWNSEESRRTRQQKFEAAEARRKRKQNFERAMALAARRRRTRPCMPPMAYVEEVIPAGGLPSPPRCILFSAPELWNPSTSFDTLSKCQLDNKVSDPSTATMEQQYSPCYVEEEAPPEPTNEKDETGREQWHRTQNTDEDTSKEQPPVADWRHLDLVLEIRHQLNDQTFLLEGLDQRMDMFFGAHSRASTKKQCPTCARPYTFPARWRHSDVQE